MGARARKDVEEMSEAGGFLEEVMERQLKAGIAILMLSYFGACAPVAFDTQPADPTGIVKRCTGAACFYDVVDGWTTGKGKVDILIVNDNSGSMSTEQAKMASAFSGFIASLEANQGLDYRIAMTTTDVSDNRVRIGAVNNPWYNPPGPANKDGALQDGKLVLLGSQSGYFLASGESGIVSLFDQAVKRGETLLCEQSGFTNCPSGDERGIHAANLTIQNYSSQFMRSDAHLAVIVLADEDERGVSKYNPCVGASNSFWNQYCATAAPDYWNDRARDYSLQPLDEPQSFVDNFRKLFPGKTMTWNSIIIPDPMLVAAGEKDKSALCLAQQTGQSGNPNVKASYGSAYHKLSLLTGGKVGSICDSNYTNTLQNIGYMLQNVPNSRSLKCLPVDSNGDGRRDLEVRVNGQTVLPSAYNVDYEKMLVWSDARLAPNTTIELRYTCGS